MERGAQKKRETVIAKAHENFLLIICDLITPSISHVGESDLRNISFIFYKEICWRESVKNKENTGKISLEKKKSTLNSTVLSNQLPIFGLQWWLSW